MSRRPLRRNVRRPSCAERAPDTQAIAAGLAEGRLTAPAGRPLAPRSRSRGILALAAVALLTGGVTFAVVVEPVEPDPAAEGAGQAEIDAAADAWEPQPIADELEAVAPLQDTTIGDAIAAARTAGFTAIEQIDMFADRTAVTGVDDSGELRMLHFEPNSVGVLTDARGTPGVALDEDELDIDLDEVIDRARDASDAGPDDEMRSIRVYGGDGSALSADETGTLVQVIFESGQAITFRGADLTVLR